MKNYITIIAIVFALFSCSEKETMTYQSERYLYFTTSLDSADLSVSFSHYPTSDEYKAGFEVNLMGNLLTEKANYRVSVVDTGTTALPEEYVLDLEPEFGANQLKDTLYVVLKKTERLSDGPVTLMIKLEEGNGFIPGLSRNRTVKVHFNNVESKPLWWEGDIISVYLGEYSPEKYKHFLIATQIDATEIPVLLKENPTKLRLLALEFKDYLTLHPELNLTVPIY
ncbi:MULTISPECIES: DUF4843 domain-containing protein [Butyricimonas]|uniref:DUF4843 domain-containing protein n=1 Tax=Butyricimonas TaxID=574697 RepID=UPI00159BC40F|nr:MULTISPECIES: DUF4843 domain-containing protein [Butyricimonas]MCB6973407.1 DUF4843 domain-containing protein [Butyricimonas synergistica]MCG4520122.1 DUF4843 domain-containing protein [Butyricimonas sp. DFI.6.44]